MNFKVKLLDFEKEQVTIGDVYEFVFNIKYSIFGIGEKVAEYLVEKTDQFEVERSYLNESGQLVLQCKVLKNPLPFLVVFGILAAGSATILWMFGLQLDKVQKIITIPEGKILVYAFAGVLGLALYKILRV